MTRASWPEVRLGDYSDIQMGFAFKSKDFSEQEVGPRLLLGANVAPGRADWGKLRFWPAAELEDLDRYQLAAGDVVLAMDRPWIPAGLKVLRIDSADLPCLLVQRVARLRGSESLDTRFLYLLLSHPAFTVYILGVQTGSTVPHISGRQIADYSIALPPIDEQRRIAALLGALDDKIELNRKMNRTLEEMAQAIFKSWFIDFDGVPDSELVESELGPIPRGWEVAALREHVTLDKGLSYKGKFLTDAGVPMVNLKCVKPHGGFRRDAAKPYSGDFKPRHRVRAGDIIVANTDLTQARDILGCPAFVPPIAGADTIITSHHTFAVRFARQAKIGRHFLYHMLLSPGARRRCRGFATGTTVLAVPRDALLDFEFPLPDPARLAGFEHIASLFRQRIEANENENETLARTRDALLPKLISGEIRVPEAEEAVEAAL